MLQVLGPGLTIGLAHPRLGPRPVSTPPPLELAARTASTSYRGSLTAERLGKALVSGEMPAGFEAHVHALVDEAPVALLARVVEQMHAEAGMPREAVWMTLRGWGRELKSRRSLWSDAA